MNQKQKVFIERAIRQLKEVTDACGTDAATTAVTLGRKRVSKYVVVVRIVAELDRGFSAPLGSHASKPNAQPGTQPDTQPDYSKKTEHHNTRRTSRWHKPIF